MKAKTLSSFPKLCFPLLGKTMPVQVRGKDIPGFAGVLDRDVLLVDLEAGAEPENKRVVLILVGRKEFIIAKHFKRAGRSYFRPMPPHGNQYECWNGHKVLKLPGDDVTVIGVVKGLFRQYN